MSVVQGVTGAPCGRHVCGFETAVHRDVVLTERSRGVWRGLC